MSRTLPVVWHPNTIRTCGDCAPDVIDTALREHQFSSLPVEVLPLKRVA